MNEFTPGGALTEKLKTIRKPDSVAVEPKPEPVKLTGIDLKQALTGENKGTLEYNPAKQKLEIKTNSPLSDRLANRNK